MPRKSSPQNYYCLNCGYTQPLWKGNQCGRCKKVGEELVLLEKPDTRFSELLIINIILILMIFSPIIFMIIFPSNFSYIDLSSAFFMIFIIWLIVAISANSLIWIMNRRRIDPNLIDSGEEISGVQLIYFHPIYKKCKKYRRLRDKHKISDTEYQNRKEEILKYWMGDNAKEQGFSITEDGIVRFEKKKDP
jgi:hypothetical protein